MKISQLFTQKKAVWSFEIFPPKPTADIGAVRGTIEALAKLSPDYISVTCSAGGSGNSRTPEIAELVKACGVEPLAHLTCINSEQNEIDEALLKLHEGGVGNILALRGDRIEGAKESKTFRYAADLVRYIRRSGYDFDLAAACYPEGHPEAPDLVTDIRRLKEKVDAGVTLTARNRPVGGLGKQIGRRFIPVHRSDACGTAAALRAVVHFFQNRIYQIRYRVCSVLSAHQLQRIVKPLRNRIAIRIRQRDVQLFGGKCFAGGHESRLCRIGILLVDKLDRFVKYGRIDVLRNKPFRQFLYRLHHGKADHGGRHLIAEFLDEFFQIGNGFFDQLFDILPRTGKRHRNDVERIQ